MLMCWIFLKDTSLLDKGKTGSVSFYYTLDFVDACVTTKEAHGPTDIKIVYKDARYSTTNKIVFKYQSTSEYKRGAQETC